MEEITSGITEFYEPEQGERRCVFGSKENVINRTEKLTPEKLPMRLKFSKDKDHNGEWRLTTLNGPAKAWSGIEEGQVIESPDAYADHKAMSRNLRKRKRADDATCRHCVNFPSKKSSRGRMRCHKRNWRGVSPPSEENTLVPGLPAIDFKSSDQVLPPLNWSVTAKRGRKEKTASKPKYQEESEDPIINAAYNLLLLADGISPGSTPMKQQQNINSVPYDSRVMNNGDDLKISTQLDSMNVNSTSVEVDKTKGSNQNINELKIHYNKTGETLSHQSAINKPTKKKDVLEIVTDLASDQKQYPCSICNKSFSSHQALGGHTTRHYKSKSNSRVAMVEGIKEAKLAESECLIGRGGLPMEVLEHRCNICGRTFPTGQALGGHKRKHWPGPENRRVASSSESARKASHPRLDIDLNKPLPDSGPENRVASSSESARKESHPRLDIDLNKPPPDWA